MICPATPQDLEAILEIYRAARAYMARTGNPTQWGDHYPPRALLEEDLARERLYLCVRARRPCGVFMFQPGPDPTYARIYEGAWLNDAPYGVLHRVASDGREKGVFGEAFGFCREKTGSLRIDTHRQNTTMQHVLEKYGFRRCGIIYLPDGGERLAYQFEASASPGD